MRTLIATLSCLALVSIFVGPAGADDMSCHADDYVVVPVGGMIYVDIRALYPIFDPADKFLFNVWVYEETNGEAGLQRGDDGDYCVESADPDRLLGV